MFEIANCFLEGVGVKKAPDIAMAYLRFAGNLGDLAAQEREWQSFAFQVQAEPRHRARISLVKRRERREEGHVSSPVAGRTLVREIAEYDFNGRKEAAKWYRMAAGVAHYCKRARTDWGCADWPGLDKHVWFGLGVESES